MRLIDADVLKAKLLEERDKIPRTIEPKYKNVLPPTHSTYSDYVIGGIRKAFRCMENTPTFDPVKHGQWVWINVADKSNVGILTYDYRIQCSSCGIMPNYKYDIPNCTAEKMKYCPNCGAKMCEEAKE